MKIVQICPYAMERPGGVQGHVRDLARWLTAQGHETRIIAPPAPGKRPIQDRALTELGRSRELAVHGTAFELSYASPGAVRRAVQDLRDWGADLVHMHTPWTPLLAWQLWRGLKLPTVTTIHATLPSLDSTALVDRYIRRAARYFLTRVDATVTPSASVLPLLHSLVPGAQTQILPPAVDLSGWRAADGARDPDAVSLVFLGRLEARKGVADLLAAWSKIADHLPQATLTIAGDGAMRADVEAAKAPRLRYVGRPDNAAAKALVGHADIFVAPAGYGESFGIVLTEAMSAGAVPIAAANPGYASVMTGDGSALLVPPGDSTALAERIATLVNDTAELRRLQAWGRAHAKQFDIAAAGLHYEALFHQVLANT